MIEAISCENSPQPSRQANLIHFRAPISSALYCSVNSVLRVVIFKVIEAKRKTFIASESFYFQKISFGVNFWNRKMISNVEKLAVKRSY